jgi:hypothetical protein
VFDSTLLDIIACTLGKDKHDVYVEDLEQETDEDLMDRLESIFNK